MLATYTSFHPPRPFCSAHPTPPKSNHPVMLINLAYKISSVGQSPWLHCGPQIRAAKRRRAQQLEARYRVSLPTCTPDCLDSFEVSPVANTLPRLFDKRGAKYSSRPENYVGNELICPNETHILLVPYGQQWRTFRKALQTILSVTAVNQLFPIQNAEALQTMHQLITDPAGYYDHIRRYSTAVILSSVYGQRGATFESPKVQALYHAQEQFTSILAPGATPPVDAFPWLKYVPRAFAGWKGRAEAIRAEQRHLYYSLMLETKEKMAKGTRTGSFIERILMEQEKLGLDDEHVAYLGGILVRPNFPLFFRRLHH